jgi:hypothetical protein
VRMGFRTVVLTSVTWNEGFVSQGCSEDGEGGEGVLRIVFQTVVLTSVTWIWVFVSQGCGEDGVSDCCADLCDME